MNKSLLLTWFLLGISLPFTIHAQNLYDTNIIQEIRIYFDQPDWDRVLDSLKQEGYKKRIKCTVKFQGKTYKEVGIRFKGNSSYNNARNVYGRKMPLNIDADEFVEGQKFGGQYEKMKLANCFRDPSFVREVLAYEIANKYMPAPKANFMNVYINDEHYGFYTNTQSINEDFVEEHFGDPKKILIKCDPEWGQKKPSTCPPHSDKATLQFLGKDTLCYMDTYELKSGTGWDELIALTASLSHKGEKISDILDVDRALWMLAYNNVLVNLDSYTGRLSHNYYLVQDDAGRLSPLIWDLNLCFGGFRFDGTGKPLSNKEMQELSPFIHFKNPERPLIYNLLQVPMYRKIYIAHMKTILEENFTNQSYKRRAESLQRQVDYHVQKDESKFYSQASFKANINQSTKAGDTQIIGIAELMDARATYLKTHPLFLEPAPKISNVQHKIKDGKVVITAKIEGASKVLIAYRDKGETKFEKGRLHDDGKHDDYQAGDGFYGRSLDYSPGLQFYIYAENNKAAILSPERAEYEFHEVK